MNELPEFMKKRLAERRNRLSKRNKPMVIKRPIPDTGSRNVSSPKTPVKKRGCGC